MGRVYIYTMKKNTLDLCSIIAQSQNQRCADPFKSDSRLGLLGPVGIASLLASWTQFSFEQLDDSETVILSPAGNQLSCISGVV
jgi:hypothetical protein